MQSTSWEMLGWKKHKLESRLWEKYQSPQICKWHHPYGRKWRGMKVKEESEKVGLKLNIRKLRSWHLVPSLHGKWTVKQWKQWHFIFLGSKIIADGDCSHEIKRCILLGRKAITNLDSVLKSKDITLPTKVRIVKNYGFSSSHVQTDVRAGP